MPVDRRPRPRPYRARPAAANAEAAVETWLDDDAGPVVRPYVVTGGRVRAPGDGFDLVAFVLAMDGEPAPGLVLQPEHRAILALADRPLSVAEISAHLDLPLGVVRVLLDDLLTGGLVAVHEPPPPDELPDERLLEAVLEGLRAL